MLNFNREYDILYIENGGFIVAISYNRLWKLLSDNGITKNEMRKSVGISTSVLAEMGKNESVSVDTLAKIAAVMDYGLDGIVEVNTNLENGGELK